MLLVHGALIIVQLLFGANYVIAKIVDAVRGDPALAKFAFREVSPLGLVAIRAWGAALILGLALRLRGRDPEAPRFTPREYGELFLYSLLGISINQAAFLEGLSRSSATNRELNSST